MRTALRKMGNSTGIIVPKAILTQLGAAAGAAYEVSIEEGRIVFAPLKDDPRAGWADAAQAVAADEREAEAADWDGFANDLDAELTW